MKRRIAAALAAAAFAIAAPARSAAEGGDVHWEFAGWYGGGCYPNLVFDPRVKGRVYLASDVAGIWRSDDLGENWKFATQGLGNLEVSVIAVSPADSNVLYAGTSGGLYRSLDAGGRWELCDTASGQIAFRRPENYNSVAVSPRDASVVAVGTARGLVFYSNDYGRHWKVLGFRKQPFKSDKAIPVLAFTEDAKALWVGGRDGILRYDFGPRRLPWGMWRSFRNGPERVTDFFIPAWEPGTIYAAGGPKLLISRDSGRTWTESSPVPKHTTLRVTGALQSGRTVLWVVWWEEGHWKGGVLSSDDGGRTWTKRDNQSYDPALNPTRVWATTTPRTNSLRVDPFDTRVLFRTDWWGVFRTDDGGETWIEKIRGAPNTVGSDLHFGPDGALYVATMDDGLLRSRDGGRSYEPLFPRDSWHRSKNGDVWRVLVPDAEGRNILATSSPSQEDVNQVILSGDSGENFELIREGLPGKKPRRNTMWDAGFPKAVAWHPARPEVVYLGIDGDDGGGLFVSRNGGRTWARSPGQPASRRVYNGLAVDPRDPSRLYWGAYGDKGGVYLSEDGGASWRRIFEGLAKVIDIAVSKKGVIYAAGSASGPALYMSRDDGSTWRAAVRFGGEGSCDALALHPRSDGVLAVSTEAWKHRAGGRIYLSRDGGEQWEDITGDLPPGTGAAAMAFDPSGEWLYLSRYAGSVYRTRFADVTAAHES